MDDVGTEDGTGHTDEDKRQRRLRMLPRLCGAVSVFAPESLVKRSYA
jgi:hypothetical protein